MLTKEEIREAIWEKMTKQNVARFPGALGRIPNFIGAEAAAARLDEVPAWREARVIKANPDAPQRAVRHRALKEGKRVYMAVPRLRMLKCFLELDPQRLGKKIYEASSIKGSSILGRPVTVEEMPPIDLVVCGSVAVSRGGGRIGKGGGYSDLEYGLAKEAGIVSARTITLTTVHPVQIVPDPLPLVPHDFPLDYIVTREEIIRCGERYPEPRGIYWDDLSAARISEIPALALLRERRSP
ncbi:MAG TPA: 5-formyltetrahydrofolate cyclo-ligase [Nitrospiria bacterium]|nr:5-formyltetrahydrofolate cyclo-ligase [Nitrospiria bacterium]